MPTVAKVFISYAHEDLESARRLFEDLRSAGLNPWLDEESIKVGQDWQFEINNAISGSDFFVALLSTHSVTKRGFFQRELRQALDLLEEVPPGRVFIIPARLEECEVHESRIKKIQRADLFAGWDEAVEKIVASISGERLAARNDERYKTALRDPGLRQPPERRTLNPAENPAMISAPLEVEPFAPLSDFYVYILGRLMLNALSFFLVLFLVLHLLCRFVIDDCEIPVGLLGWEILPSRTR